MPATRSSSRLATGSTPSLAPSSLSKRKTTSTGSSRVPKKSRKSSIPAGSELQPEALASTSAATASLTTDATVPGSTAADILPENAGNEDAPVPAILTFDFEEAKSHLIRVDARFQDLFDRMACGPFEQLELLHPFRALVVSILGQQISWKAARSITHKFIRLFNPSLPEEVTDGSRKQAMAVFPTPHQVADTDLAVLRTAGLSARKAEFVQDLAKRFADGRLSTDKLRSATDEELAEMLIQVKGIGRWTVDMFAIFSLRRPDILPVGDLGVQRGMVRWFLSQHSPAHPYGLSPEKVGDGKEKKRNLIASGSNDEGLLPATGDALNVPLEPEVIVAAESAVGQSNNLLPTPFTPSIHRTLAKSPKVEVSLPAGLSVSVLKSRLDGKKVKGAFLSPQEMTDLTETWKPYRSLGVYYMWSLADPTGK